MLTVRNVMHDVKHRTCSQRAKEMKMVMVVNDNGTGDRQSINDTLLLVS